MRKIIMVALVAAICIPFTILQAQETYEYAQRTDSALYLDVWRPAQPRADRACVVALFGGGFVSGERNNKFQCTVAKMLTDRGFTVVSPDYRLGLKDSAMVASHQGLAHMQDLFTFCINIATEDCADVVAWVCAHAGELNIDTAKMVLTGSSAGAITVLQLDWSRANGMALTAALPQGWRPAAVVPYSGAIMCRKSKLHYATPPAPTMFMHGTKDKIVAYKRFPPVLNPALYGSNTVVKEFKKHGYPHWILRYEGIGHEVASFLPGSIDLFCAFVEQAFAGRVESLDATVKDRFLEPTKWTNMNVFELYE